MQSLGSCALLHLLRSRYFLSVFLSVLFPCLLVSYVSSVSTGSTCSAGFFVELPTARSLLACCSFSLPCLYFVLSCLLVQLSVFRLLIVLVGLRFDCLREGRQARADFELDGSRARGAAGGIRALSEHR